jgi:hypothetical protein
LREGRRLGRASPTFLLISSLHSPLQLACTGITVFGEQPMPSSSDNEFGHNRIPMGGRDAKIEPAADPPGPH